MLFSQAHIFTEALLNHTSPHAQQTICSVPVVPVRHTGILLVTSAWAGQPVWSLQKTITLNLHKEKKKTWLH